MKVITLTIEDEVYENLKLFRDGYLESIHHREKPPSSQSPQRKTNWHEITLTQLRGERPDLVAAVLDAKGIWARAVCDMVKAIESPPKDSSLPTVHLKYETQDDWIRRYKGNNNKGTGCLLVFVTILAGFTAIGKYLWG